MEVDECSKPINPTLALKNEQSGICDLFQTMFNGDIENLVARQGQVLAQKHQAEEMKGAKRDFKVESSSESSEESSGLSPSHSRSSQIQQGYFRTVDK
jgi:hypothetical protein